jgi:U4/U6 small nuclear ribonucleoprotein PRP3
VADPSKIELKVIQQMQKRVLNHEMRNLANKLTPSQRKAKKIKKLQDDVSKGLIAAVFLVTDFSCLKYRFKVDVTAQELFLSGLGWCFLLSRLLYVFLSFFLSFFVSFTMS